MQLLSETFNTVRALPCFLVGYTYPRSLDG